MSILKKLKEWATDGPSSKPAINLVELFLVATTTERIKRYGYPYHLEWASSPIRRDN
jgi:hypothetical protein